MDQGIRRVFGRSPHLRDAIVSSTGETLEQITERVDDEFQARRSFFADGALADSRWNGWRLYPRKLILRFEAVIDETYGIEVGYEVDLLTCWQSAGVLDWIIQVSGKDWPELDMDKVTAGFLYAVDDVLHPQASLCSFGQNLTLTAQQITDRVAVFVQQFHEGEQP